MATARGQITLANIDESVMYELFLQETVSIGRTADGGYSPSVIKVVCGYRKASGSSLIVMEDPTDAVDGKWVILFRRRLRETGEYESNYIFYTNGTTAVTSFSSKKILANMDVATYDAVEFYLCSGNGTVAYNGNYYYLQSITGYVDKKTTYIVSDGAKGEDGDEAVAVSLVPQSVIIEQQADGDHALILENAKTNIRVVKGEKDVTSAATIVSIVPSTYVYNDAEYNSCSFAVYNGYTVAITAVGTKGTVTANGKTVKNYVTQGYIDIVIAYAGVIYQPVRLSFYCNLLGTWQETVAGDTKTEIAEGLSYAYDPTGENVLSFETIGTYIRSSQENISTIQQQVSNLTGKNLMPIEGWRYYDDTEEVRCDVDLNLLYAENAYFFDIVSPILYLPAGTYSLSFEMQAKGTDGNTLTPHAQLLCSNRYERTDIGDDPSSTIPLTPVKVKEDHSLAKWYCKFNTTKPQYVSLDIWKQSGGTDRTAVVIKQVQLEEGDAATDFVPYVIPTVLQSEIRQTAGEIELKVNDTGINLNDGTIQLIGEKTNFVSVKDGTPYIAVGLETATYNGVTAKVPYFKFYAPDGTEMYNLGYTGLRQIVNNSVPDEWEKVVFMGFSTDGDVVSMQAGDEVNPLLVIIPTTYSHKEAGDSGWFVGVTANKMGEAVVWQFHEGYTIGAGGQRIYNYGGSSPSEYDGKYYYDRETNQYGEPSNPVNPTAAKYGWFFHGKTEALYIAAGKVVATADVAQKTQSMRIYEVDPVTRKTISRTIYYYELYMEFSGQSASGLVNYKGGTDMSEYVLIDFSVKYVGELVIPDFKTNS